MDVNISSSAGVGITDPQGISPVGEANQKHDDALGSIEDAVAKLEMRLAPVLRPDDIPTGHADALHEIQEPASPLVNYMRQRSQQATTIHFALRRLLERLEI